MWPCFAIFFLGVVGGDGGLFGEIGLGVFEVRVEGEVGEGLG